MRKPLLSLGIFASIVAAAVAVAFLLRAGDSAAPPVQQIALAPSLDDVLITAAGDRVEVRGTVEGADHCEVRAQGVSAPIVEGAFSLTITPPQTVGPTLIWLELVCDGDVVATRVRRLEVAAQAEGSGAALALLDTSAPVPVARLRVRADAVLDQVNALALEAANAQVQALLRDDIRNSDAISLEVPLDRWANAAQAWARARLEPEAAERLERIVPDNLPNTSLTVAWGDQTDVRLSNLSVRLEEGIAYVRFDARVVIDAEVTANPPIRRRGQGWDPEPLVLEMGRVGATIDVRAWPEVSVRDVDLVGDLCDQPDRGFWRRACAEVAPRAHALVERPVTRWLNDRANAWAASFDLSALVREAFLGFGMQALGLSDDGVASIDALLQASGFQVVVEQVDAEALSVLAVVDPTWLGDDTPLGASTTPLAAPAAVTVSLPLLNRGLRYAFDRPLGEVAGAVAQMVRPFDAPRADALVAFGARLQDTSIASGARWEDALALANLQLDAAVKITPILTLQDGRLTLTVFDARAFRGVTRDDVQLSISARLPVVFEPVGEPARGFAPVLDVNTMVGHLALEPIGPPSTTRDDVARFAAFLSTEVRRSMGLEPGTPVVDFSGLAGLERAVPVIPAEHVLGAATVTLRAMRIDAAANGFELTGDVRVNASPE